jgi:hypothetical protein
MNAPHENPPPASPDPGGQDDPNAPNGSFPPTHSRLANIVAGLSQWTPEEREWLKSNPKWLRYEEELREALEQAPGPAEGSAEHANRERIRRLRFDPPSRN